MHCLHRVYALLTKLLEHDLRPLRLSLRDRNPLRFSNGVPAVRPYFLATAPKSRQKRPLSGNTPNSITAPCVILPSDIRVGRRCALFKIGRDYAFPTRESLDFHP